jgi:hypothetical protein
MISVLNFVARGVRDVALRFLCAPRKFEWIAVQRPRSEEELPINLSAASLLHWAVFVSTITVMESDAIFIKHHLVAAEGRAKFFASSAVSTSPFEGVL